MKSTKFLLVAVVCTGFLSVGCKTSATHTHDGQQMQSTDCKCGKGCTDCKADAKDEKKCGCGAG